MLILASKSPRRSDLLTQAGYQFRVEVSDAEEIMDPSISFLEIVKENARRKAVAVAEKIGSEIPVLGADTIVVIDGKIFGKPKDANDAEQMLMALSDKAHTVSTGIALIYRGKTHLAVETTKVVFSKLSREDVKRYIASGEPFGKAGAYAVQGRAAVFISRIEGSFSNVVGLPLFLLAETAKKAGVDLYGSDGT